ncbi:transglycosylase domain-containing protein, partial [Bordetella hinzii]|nr:transglycosylase domain-containing protein [Bordetella hinzii]
MTRRRRRLALAGAALAALPLAALFVLDRVYPLPSAGSAGARVVIAADGTPLRNYPSRDGVWRYPVTPEQVSPRYLQTLLAYEDRWFYWHPGINPWAMA